MTPACAIAPGDRSGLATQMASDRSARRRLLPLTLITLASVLALLAIFALWANRQLLDTDNWTETSSELLENDEIRGQLAIFLIDELYANVDVPAELAEAFPPRLQPPARSRISACVAWIRCSSARVPRPCGRRRIGVPIRGCSRSSRTVAERP